MHWIPSGAMDTALHADARSRVLVAAPRQRRCRAAADSGWTRTNIHGRHRHAHALVGSPALRGRAGGRPRARMTGTAHASDPARAGEAWHEIFLPFGNAMCVDVAGGSAAADARLQLSRCHGYASNGASQRWSFSGGRFHQYVEHEQRPVHRLPRRRPAGHRRPAPAPMAAHGPITRTLDSAAASPSTHRPAATRLCAPGGVMARSGT